MRRILFITMFLLFLCVSSFGMAFDNHRRGFIIGGLGGIAVTTWAEFEPEEPDDVKVNNGANITLHFVLRIGVGLGDKFMIYNWSVMDWFGGGNFNYKESSYFTFHIISGTGASYYFKPTSPSLYINAGIGASLWDGLSIGFNAMGGIGYEFTRHWSVECGVMYGDTRFLFWETDFLAISLSIIGIAY